MSARVVVLGGCGAWPEAGRACSGFVVEHRGFRVVLDLGYGTLPRLFALLGSSTGDGVDAVIVTHNHPDHMVDLHGFFRARWFSARDAPAVPLYAPAGVIERLVALEDDVTAATDIASVLDQRPLPGQALRARPVRTRELGAPASRRQRRSAPDRRGPDRRL